MAILEAVGVAVGRRSDSSCSNRPRSVMSWPVLTRRRLPLAIAALAAASCQSSHPLQGSDGDSDPAVSFATPDGSPDAGASADCGPPMEFAPCRFDPDCRSAYLVCVPPDVTITLCRDPDAGVDPTCPSFPEFSTAPVCPATVQVTSTVCEVRYQRPCTVDADCGPAGFTCMGGRCQQQTGRQCTTASECPNEWGCYAPCGCPGTLETTVCEPPFAEFRCPACAPIPG
jgi:hypothetical protein